MDPRPYELRLEISPITEAVEDAITESFDCLIASHAGVTSVTLSAVGDTCEAATLSAIQKLRDLGAVPIRLIDDLVGRREIARRAGVTPQAVGLWIRGERHAAAHFPPPFVDAGGGLWLWGEVVPDLANRGGRPATRNTGRICGSMSSARALEGVADARLDPQPHPVRADQPDPRPLCGPCG